MSFPKASEVNPTYFDLQAYWGATKHMGGRRTTEELSGLCRIGNDSCVLDVGCGVGATSTLLAKKYGARVVGVDVSELMIERARKRVERERLGSKVELKVADVCSLPFEDGGFDVIVCESVLTFVRDKERALREMTRVLKPDGYIGLNEEVWLKAPLPGLLDYVSRTWGIEAQILSVAEWQALLEKTGLQVVLAQPRRYGISLKNYSGELFRYGLADYGVMFCRFFKLLLANRGFRKYLRGRYTSLPRGFFDYLGYGIFVGEK